MKKYYVEYTIIKNKDKIPTGRFKRSFLTSLGANKFIVELLYSKKRDWYKYVRNVKSNAKLRKRKK